MSDLSRWEPPNPEWRAPVRERNDGLRVHLGGFIRGPGGEVWSINRWSHTRDPLWRRAVALEPTRHRAMMLYADLRWPTVLKETT